MATSRPRPDEQSRGHEPTRLRRRANRGRFRGRQDPCDPWLFATSAGTFTTVDAPGATITYVYRINDGGQIVGVFQDSASDLHGYLRTSGGAFTTFDAPGATETHADGINSAGQIVGLFEDAGGKGHGYVATLTR